MDTTLKALRDITLKSDNRPAVVGFLPKVQTRNSQGPTRALPYIPNIRDIRGGKEEFIKHNRLNISMEGSAERPYQYTDSHTNKSFDMDFTKGDGFSISNGANYPRKAGFTRNMLIINKDKTMFSGTRQNDRNTNDEDEERALLRKLQEIREKKEAILRMMAENEKKQKEKEAFQERIFKLRNDSAQKIQVRWRIYKEQQASRKQTEAKKSETIKKVVSRCEALLVELNQRLVQENSNLNKNIQIIQRNIRKFLAKKKFKGLWRRKISTFLQQRICQTLFKCQVKPSFQLLKDHAPAKTDNSTFFVTSNPVIPGYTIPTQDSEFDEARNLRSSRTIKGRISASPKSSTSLHICKKHSHQPKKGECVVSLNNTSITSLHTGLEHLEPGQITKNRSSKFCVDTKSISNISETVNPEDEITTRKQVVKARKPAASLPPKSIPSISSVDTSKKGYVGKEKVNERRAFKIQ